MGGRNMKKKLLAMLVCMIIIFVNTVFVFAADETDPYKHSIKPPATSILYISE